MLVVVLCVAALYLVRAIRRRARELGKGTYLEMLGEIYERTEI